MRIRRGDALNVTGLRLLTRDGCHLCEEFWLQLSLDLGPAAGDVSLLDVDGDQDLAVSYGQRVPVLLLGDQVVCEGRYDRERVRRALRV